jgi:hypothetical protein
MRQENNSAFRRGGKQIPTLGRTKYIGAAKVLKDCRNLVLA